MTEVRVHAAFKVKDEETFLKEAAKIVEATQVDCFFEPSIPNSLIVMHIDETTRTITPGHTVFAINSLRPRKDVSTTSCTRRLANLAATP